MQESSSSNASDGEQLLIQMKLRLLTCQARPAVLAQFLTGHGPVPVHGPGG